MDLYNISPLVFISFLLILMRISVIIFFLPFFGADFIPQVFKALICIVLTLAVWTRIPLASIDLPTHPLALIILFLHELFFGLAVGISIQAIFAGLQTSGELMGLQMGFSMISFADPLSGAQITVTSHLIYMTAMVLFLIFNGHLFLLQALMESFNSLPIGSFSVDSNVTEAVIAFSANIFVTAIRIAAPVICALFLSELALALVGRAAPQLNLLTFGFPIKIALGFFFLSLILAYMSLMIEGYSLDAKRIFLMLSRLGS